MRIAIIEHGCREYILDTFKKHPEFDGEICGFVEHCPKKEEDQGFPVVSLTNLKKLRLDAVLIAVKENRYLSRLLTFLHCEGIRHVYVIRLFALDTRADFLVGNRFVTSAVDSISDEKPYLVHLESHVCDHCNLNCKACNNFAPFVTEPSFADTQQFETDMQRLSELFSGIGRLFLLGGEPLLAPELSCEMIRLSRKYFPNTELRLLTNALLLPKMPDEFWNCVREQRVIIHISLYPPVKPKISEIEAVLKQQEATYIIFKDVSLFCKHWTEYPFEDGQFNNQHCGSGGCHYLQDGILAKCPDAVLIGKMADAMNRTPEELQSKDNIRLSNCTDGWEVIRALDAPIDLCRKCTYRRKELVEWGQVDKIAQPADWLIPHAFEAENLKLKGRLENLSAQLKLSEDKRFRMEKDRENDQLKSRAEIERLKESKAQMNKIKQELESELSESREELKRLRESEARLEKMKRELENEQRRSRRELERLKAAEAKWRGECEKTKRSLSFRVGRFVTWFPRKLRGLIRCLREHGVKDTAKLIVKKIAKTVLPDSLVKLNDMFLDHVVSGYRIYEELLNKYGDDAKILACAWHGTGDYYICGLYLDSWLKVNNVKRFIFLSPGGAEYKVASLFPTLASGTICFDKNKYWDLYTLSGFVDVDRCNLVHLHHQEPFHFNLSRMVTNSNLMGFNGLDMIDLYMLFGFKMARDTPKAMPVFKVDVRRLKYYFTEYKLLPGKTAVLSPYSTSLKEYSPDAKFWEYLAKELKRRGYTVCTNCGEKEAAVKGTVPLLLSYKEIVPFLNIAGIFIGIRSGLCDIISTSSCKKIVIHTYYAKFWPNGASIRYTGLNHMGLCQDAMELEYVQNEIRCVVEL